MTQQLNIKVDDPVAQQHSEQLHNLIIEKINLAGGFISFADYMQLCLYTPGLGYYSAGSHKLGKGGDFTTAPEISSLYGATLARHIMTVFAHLDQRNVVEFGAGSGKLAMDIISQLQRDFALPDAYYIIEISADLKQRQQQLLRASVPEYFDKIRWLDEMPSNFEGIVIANEVCDAMPIHLLQFSPQTTMEIGVGQHDNAFIWCERPLSDPQLLEQAAQIRLAIGELTYQTEVNLNSSLWINMLGQTISKGVVFIIDYGYPFSNYYQSERDRGSVMCFYQHQAHDNPLILPGLQDITAHVEFTSLAQAAVDSDMDVIGFHAQSDFLLAGNITELAQEMAINLAPEAWLRESAALKQLLLPSAMGESFKVLSLSKSLPLLPHIQRQDRRYQL